MQNNSYQAGAAQINVRNNQDLIRVVGAFPDGNSALMLVAARLRHIAGTKWGTRKYLDMSRLREQQQEKKYENI